MEEKKFNLADLLANHEGEEFYSKYCGYIRLREIEHHGRGKATLSFAGRAKSGEEFTIEVSEMGTCDPYGEDTELWPTREALWKHPFNAKAAWAEWEESNGKD